MYTLSKVPGPSDAVHGDLGSGAQGVVGVRSGNQVITLFPGAREAIRGILQGDFGPIRLAAASSADTPKAVQIGKAAMAIIEVVPGVTLLEAFRTAGGGFGPGDLNLQIGRTPPLSSNKSATHFPILR